MERKKTKGNVAGKTSSVSVHEALVEPMALGEVFMQSGMFKDIKTQAEAVVKILAGRELGIAPIEAMSNIFLVNGKVSVMSKLVGALIKKSGKYDYEVDTLNEEGCILKFYKLQDGKRIEIGTSSFDRKDAARAGLINKDIYKNYPRNMFFSRALSNGSKWFCSDVFCGYTPEELEDLPVEETTLKTIVMNPEGVIEDKEESNGSETKA